MKKYIIFITILIIVILSYAFVSKKPRDYQLEYDYNGYQVKENFVKNENLYKIYLTKDNKEYFYYIEDKYTEKRKLLNEIIENDSCIQIKFKQKLSYNLCLGETGYYFPISKNEESLIKKIDNIDVYNKDKKYYIWNNYGLTDLLNEKKYNVLKNETYDNVISYQTERYIIFKDYDQTREFNKFYIFDTKKNKMNNLSLENTISDNMYFLGNIENDVYLFDKKNKIEYKIDLNKNRIEKVSDKQGGIIFDKEWKDVPLANLEYSNLSFDNTYYTSYKLEKKKLYLIMDNKKILLNNKNIDNVIYYDKDDVYYMIENDVYSYNINEGEKKLLSSFEWNFSYKNKIFIFE